MPDQRITFRRTATGFVAHNQASAPSATVAEASEAFPCFGTTCAVFVIGDTGERTSSEAVDLARTVLLEWHDGFSRFLPDSELSRLNADPRETVPVSATMARFIAAACDAARLTGGLADPTLATEIEAAGYDGDLPEDAQGALGLREALARAPARAPGHAKADSAWRSIRLDGGGTAVSRPVGVRLDSGGIAKGLFADLLVAALCEHQSVAINCGGDLRLGGSGSLARAVVVSSPFGQETLHVFQLGGGGVATSGIGKRSWIGADGLPAHHLLDPATGRPAFTGVVQVTALAPTATEAEARTKAALLSGPDGAREWLPHGGVVVYDDEHHEVIDPPRLART
jgi:thiamine biosynthesis lipoprotein